jgi:hypothetical protein
MVPSFDPRDESESLSGGTPSFLVAVGGRDSSSVFSSRQSGSLIANGRALLVSVGLTVEEFDSSRRFSDSATAAELVPAVVVVGVICKVAFVGGVSDTAEVVADVVGLVISVKGFFRSPLPNGFLFLGIAFCVAIRAS